jgi:hypothetical protein
LAVAITISVPSRTSPRAGLFTEIVQVSFINEGVRVKEDWPVAVYLNRARGNVIADCVMAKHGIEMNAEAVREQVQMLDVRVGGIIVHQDQHASFSYPLGYLVCVFFLHIMRIGILCGNVGRNDDITTASLFNFSTVGALYSVSVATP